MKMQQDIIKFLDKTLTDKNKLSLLDDNMPGYPTKEIHVDIRKNDNTYLVGIEDLYLSENDDTYFVPSFSIGVLDDEIRLKYRITCALFEEQLKWLLEQLVSDNYELITE